jgi:hypothetical protein
MYYFLYFLVLLVSDRCWLDAIDFNNLHDLEAREFEQQGK